MDGVPQRPAAVPDDAAWIEEAGEWRSGAVDAKGDKQGLHRTWRSDGTLREEVAFVAGKGEGRYRRFHPNGDVAGEGELVSGNMQGTLRAYGCDAPTPELLQPCCVPPNAWELQTDYDRGEEKARRWYDRAGMQILESGAPHPPRPPTVPADARYDEAAGQWVVGTYAIAAGAVVHWRRWSRAGALLEEEELEAGVRHGVWRRFSEDAPAGEDGLLLECHFRRGLKHGRFLDRAIAPDRYDDPRAATEEGTFENDQAVGIWTVRDARGVVVVSRDLGVAPSEESLARSPALAPAPAPAPRLAELSRALRAERRVGESILALARSAAIAGDAAPLRALLAEATWPRAEAARQDVAAAIVENAGDALVPLVTGLVCGADAPTLLRAVAAGVKGAHHAAREIVDAALLLAPDRAACHVTRALIDVHLGDPDAARADAGRLPADWQEQRSMLLDYVRVTFPTFDFWPARIAVETLFQEFPPAPAQPLDAIREVVQKYATRLASIRAALIQQLGDARAPAWLPPDLSPLLPAGPAALRAWRFEQSFADPAAGPDAPAETEEVAVDERLPLDDQSIPSLLRLARREWAALGWLCWSCGLDRVALPTAVAPPDDFGRAAGMAIERAWRCVDKLTSGGLVAMSKGVPGFEWEGVAIDVMPRALIEIAADEHAEVRALFCWLCDATAQSPWQGDLRDGDG
jgi:antitoxin component YwqK of YwqJK toxin-antitoxin module